MVHIVVDNQTSKQISLLYIYEGCLVHEHKLFAYPFPRFASIKCAKANWSNGRSLADSARIRSYCITAQKSQCMSNVLYGVFSWHSWVSPYRIHAGPMQDPCRTHAGPMQDPCRIHAGPMQDPCRIHVGSMQDQCRTNAGPMQDPSYLFSLTQRLYSYHKYFFLLNNLEEL